MQIFELKNISGNSLGGLKSRMEMIDESMIFKRDQQKLLHQKNSVKSLKQMNTAVAIFGTISTNPTSMPLKSQKKRKELMQKKKVVGKRMAESPKFGDRPIQDAQ